MTSNTPGYTPNPTGPAAALHAPWRLSYLESLGTPSDTSVGTLAPAGKSGSFLLDYWLRPQDDFANHVIVRTGVGLILLNAFPYANGHLLVALGDPRPSLLDYEAGQREALWKMTDLAADLMQRTLEPQGINIGINQGAAAGAGVPQHLHVHLVPRWQGDVSFLTSVGNIRVIPSTLSLMAERYRKVWATLARA